jgi:hypothetical protein
MTENSTTIVDPVINNSDNGTNLENNEVNSKIRRKALVHSDLTHRMVAKCEVDLHKCVLKPSSSRQVHL